MVKIIYALFKIEVIKMKEHHYIVFGLCFFIFMLGKLLITFIPGNEIANAILFSTAVIVAAMYYFHIKDLD